MGTDGQVLRYAHGISTGSKHDCSSGSRDFSSSTLLTFLPMKTSRGGVLALPALVETLHHLYKIMDTVRQGPSSLLRGVR